LRKKTKLYIRNSTINIYLILFRRRPKKERSLKNKEHNNFCEQSMKSEWGTVKRTKNETNSWERRMERKKNIWCIKWMEKKKKGKENVKSFNKNEMELNEIRKLCILFTVSILILPLTHHVLCYVCSFFHPFTRCEIEMW